MAVLLSKQPGEPGEKEGSDYSMKDKRINHRYIVAETMEPEYDEICMFVCPEQRIMLENKAAKPGANIIRIVPYSRR